MDVRELSVYALLVAYGLVLAALFIYGLNFLYLVAQAMRFNGSEPPLPPMSHAANVTVQVPMYNERHVAGRVIDAVANLKWPRENLEIQILDDSTDDTRQIAAERVSRWQSRGVSIEHIHRERREGYKAGALASGTKIASGEFMAVFDADFVPPPDFLERTIPYLMAEERLAFVQARWEHLNARQSSLTRLQGIALDAHFGVEQFARSRAGHMFNFNGTAGIWRRAAVESAGGWLARTLTEDLDLSYRVLLAGWRGRFLREVNAPAELPPSMAAFRRQQSRWAQGSIECATLLIPQILRSRMRLADKLQAIIHLSGYILHILLFIMGLLYPLVVLASTTHPEISSLYGLGSLFALTIFGPSIFFIYGQIALKREWRWWRDTPRILTVSLLGVGMILNTMRATVRAFRSGERVFERTPKWGDSAHLHRTYQIHAQRSMLLELGWGLFNLGVVAFAVMRGQSTIAAFAGLFGVGALYVAALTLAPLRPVFVREPTGQ